MNSPKCYSRLINKFKAEKPISLVENNKTIDSKFDEYRIIKTKTPIQNLS